MGRGTLRLLALAAVLFCGSGFVFASATAFSPSTYQQPDGALEVNPGSNYVDPYFATKALLVAQDGGLDVREAALAWIRWVLPRQQRNGLFRRYCRKNGRWQSCAAADADDSMLALWMQLLYRMAPDSGMPADWKHSVALAEKRLDKLRNGRLGVYHVSEWNHAALLMDNIEVYAALRDVAEGQLRLHDPEASATSHRADQLASAIDHVFWDHHAKRFRPSLEKTVPAFYPDVVGQVYPWLANVSGPGQNAQDAWEQWKRNFGAAWIERRYDSHPWGLVAMAAEKLGDSASAECWTAQSDPLRGSSSWNVLEEAAWQSLRARFAQPQLLDPNACSAILSEP
ncbi:MAG TPA: hypothetical protein VMX38_15590 [Verrucomicrobiae bacterium]|nr:hypothetical protein [Verrucomicrobiae bacterium]